jgi:hypothetical protein
MGEGYPIYDTRPLQTEDNLGWELHDKKHGIGRYPFGELSAVNIGINCALLDIGSEGVLADVLQIRQVDAKDRELHDWGKRLDCLEEHVLSKRCKLIHTKAQNAQI